MSAGAELTHLFRALKAPAVARALPKESIVALGPPGTGKTHPRDRDWHPRVPRRPASDVSHRHPVGRAP